MSVERDPEGAGEPPAAGEEEQQALARPAETAEGDTPGHAAPPPDSGNVLPPRGRSRTGPERLLVRLVATGGIIGIGVAIAAIMVSSNSKGWLVGLVVSIVSVVLAAILWSSREL